MRVVQVIDSLEIGGAEKMAVNYANALSSKIEFSGLIATRSEGDLKFQINEEVDYFFLEKKKTLDFAAAKRLKRYCKIHKVHYIHCHTSSYFIAVLTKLLYPRIKIIWHDHNGLSEFVHTQKNTILTWASYFFSGIIVVNYQLKNWAEHQLNCDKVIYLPNFTEIKETSPNTVLNGIEGKRILCLANLRPQKNHFLLVEIAKLCKNDFPEWTFHLVGKDFKDDYAAAIKDMITTFKLEETVYVYGSKNDIKNIINQAEIGVFTSDSEGLPVALIELGLCKKPVVSTAVGEIPLIIENGKNGYILEAKNVQSFYFYLKELISNPQIRTTFGNALHETISNHNSQEAVVRKYLTWLDN